MCMSDRSTLFSSVVTLQLSVSHSIDPVLQLSLLVVFSLVCKL